MVLGIDDDPLGTIGRPARWCLSLPRALRLRFGSTERRIMLAVSRLFAAASAVFLAVLPKLPREALAALLMTWSLRALVVAPIALCLGALWASGFSEARARGLRARTRRPDSRGRRTLQGVARPRARERAEVLVTHVSTERLEHRFQRPAWVPVTSHVSGVPFELTLRSGEVVEVDATSFALEGFPEASRKDAPRNPFAPPQRKVTVALRPEDEVWVTGVLTSDAAPRGGAYRGSGGATLRAPQDEAVVIAKKPPWERWSVRARAHRSSALFGLLAVGAEALAFGARAKLTRVLGLDGDGDGASAGSGGALILVLGGVGLALWFYRRRLAEVQR
jgi:hypothetical protein